MATEPARLTPEEQQAVRDANTASQTLMSRVGVAGIQHLQIDALVKLAQDNGEPIAMALVPKAFVLTLDNRERDTVQFPKGVFPVPEALLDHWYVKAHKVVRYEGTAVPARTVPILSSNVFAGDRGIEPGAISDITTAAYTLSGLTPEQWNALTMEERGDMMMDVYQHRLRMAERAKNLEKPQEPSPPAGAQNAAKGTDGRNVS